VKYSRGLREIGDGLFAYLQPDGGWGLSNAGLVVSPQGAMLVDTLYDLRLTREMLDDMAGVLPGPGIQTLVNTHANGDHTFGNSLVGGARIVASRRTAEEMPELPPAAMAALVEQAPTMGQLGEFVLACFGGFEFSGIELSLPDETFDGELDVDVGGRRARLIEVGPAHTRGDTLVHLPQEGVLFSGDILFNGSHPIAWAGPVSNWIAACDRILELGVDVIVPGHGPLADEGAVRELRAYFEYLYEQARDRHGAGMTPLQAARDLAMDRWAHWQEDERLVVNLANIFRELDGEAGAPEPLAALTDMAAWAAERSEPDARGDSSI
jgi:glyoxylase-like metal-dependent hydrolase (beta-lactamase superfamily II)